MKTVIGLGLIIIFIFSYGIYLSLIPVRILRPEITSYESRGYFDYKGVTHVHSRASSGSGTYSDILLQAQNADLNFIVLTEVNQPERPAFAEGYFHDILVLAGGEYSYFDSRLLYYGGDLNQPPLGQSQTQVYFAELLSQKVKTDDFIVLAHPFYSKYNWKSEFPIGLDGIEVLNLKSIFTSAWNKSKLKTILGLMIYPFNPTMTYTYLINQPNDELLLWDKLNRTRKTVGYAGHDATSRLNIWGDKIIKFPTYEATFNLMSTHILTQSELTGQFSKDKVKVFEALKNGNFYFAFDILGATQGFVVEISGDKKTYLQGQELKLQKNTKLIIELPAHIRRPVQVKVIKDGEEYSSSTSQRTVLNIGAPGIYRVEVYVNPKLPLPDGNKWLPWIFSNNFYIHDQ